MLDDVTIFANDYPARVVVCDACGSLSRDPRFSPDAQVAIYAEDDYADEWLERSFQRYYQAFARRMPGLIRRVGKQAKVLEVGSYVGGFLAAARDAGWQAHGIDVGKRVTQFSRAKGLDVVTGTLEAAKMPDASLDAVFVWDCMDQLANPRATLVEAHRLIKPGGWLFVQVPSGEFVELMEKAGQAIGVHRLQEPIWKMLTYAGLAGFPHQTGFTPRALKQLLAGHEFNAIRIKSRVNLLEGAAQAPFDVREQVRYLRFARAASDLIDGVSLRSRALGPWMEAVARKTQQT